jgi:hypothetical protein
VGEGGRGRRRVRKGGADEKKDENKDEKLNEDEDMRIR